MERFFRSFLGRVLKFFLLLALVLSVGLWAWGFREWFWSLWLAFLWLSVNSFLLNQLFEIALSGDRRKRKSIFVICLVKFPVLYLVGLWMLRWPPVKLEGVFFAFTLYILVLGVMLAGGKLSQKGNPLT